MVTISGQGFTGALGECSGTVVWFGIDPSEGFAILSPEVKVISDRQILAVVPPSDGGPVDVHVHDSCGTSPGSGGDRFTYLYPASQCLSGRCRIDVGSGRLGPISHVADGLLNGFSAINGTPGLRQLIDALSLRSWRTGAYRPGVPGSDPFAFCNRCRSGTSFSLDLTTDWVDWASVNAPYAARAPYVDLAAYEAFIYGDVVARVKSGQTPQYYDVYNEPTGGTIGDWLNVYGAAYDAIKRADPDARVVGPSIDSFLVPSPGDPNGPGYKLDLTDFLNWEMSSGRRFAAVSWHEDGSPPGAIPSLATGGPPVSVPGGLRDAWSPAAIGQHVLQARALLSRYPALRGTQLFVNEYGPAWAANIPGWMVGDFDVLEMTQPDEAMLTCPSASACGKLLDGLIGWHGAPQMPYWVLNDYASMRGTRLAVDSASSNLYALATHDSTRRRVEVLLGRADDCSGGGQCPQFHGVPGRLVSIAVKVTIPWRTRRVTVAVQRLPDSARNPIGDNDVPVAPATKRITVRVRRGHAAVRVADFADGDAADLTITPVSARRKPVRGSHR